MRPPRHSIRIRLAVQHAALALVPLGVAGIIGVAGAAQLMRQRATDTIGFELERVGAEVRMLLGALRDDADAARVFALGVGPRDLPHVLRTFAFARPEYGSVFALSDDGVIVARAVAGQGRDSPYYATLGASLAPGSTAVIPVELRADAGDLVRPTLAVVTPLSSTSAARVVVLELDADTLFNIFRRTSDPLGGVLGVVTRDGRFLFHSAATGQGRALLLASPHLTLAREFPGVDAQALRTQDHGQFLTGDRFVVFQTLPSADPNPDDRLVVYREVSYHMLTAPARRLSLWLGGTLALTLVLAVAVAALAARRFTGPILQLRDASRALAEGRLDAPLEIATGDEIEELAHDFAAMAAEVQQRRQALERLVTELRTTEARLRDEEAALRHSEATYRSLVESAPHAICRAAADGTLLAVNPAMVTILGYDSPREVLARKMPGAVYADPSEWTRLTQQLREDQRVVGRDTWWAHRDGHAVAVRVSGQSVHDVEGAELFELIAEDVSDRRSLEDQLRQAQKLEAVGQLAGGMAHDFNNLLTAILGSAELIGADVPPEASMRQDIEAIRKAAERGRDLIRKLLGFTRQEPLSLRRVHLRDHLREFVDVLRRVVRESVEMDVVFGEDEPAVLVDPGALEQVLLNLITNARDAVTAGGRITIQTGRSVMDQDFCAGHGWGTPGEYGTLIVSDTGVGMPPEVRRRVFEPFFTTKPVGAGTGLGMSLVYGLVRQQNGHVQVYSEVGRGTVVRVYLPATVEPEPRTIVAPSTPAPRASNESILLVEDEEWVRKVAQKVLLRHGYRVVLASDGAEALEIVRKSEAFDLIVSDVVMPNMGGPQLQVELQREGRNPKILFTSGYTDRDIAHAASLPPDAPFLSKPWTIDEFLSRVREVLNA